ncbi:flavodoxin family protein [uncultured Parabacteroides sp.]|uniref:flavodoxin family protein n=1 Tax=uncultured Parabacteroides sp. TaxID=512312 RepID=UPI0025DCB898|nr:flavodoxin family protein [uncultured Parabacteroides sp.]
MRITIINGSPRKSGATAKILKEIKKRLETRDNVSIAYYDISSKPIKTCIGCMQCYNTGVCHMNDYAEELNTVIRDSEGLIIGSPTYVSNIPGILKNYIDRGHFVVEQALKNKYTLSVVTYEIAGGGTALKTLNNLFRYSSGIITGSILCKLKFNTNPLSDQMIKRIHQKTDTFYNAIRERKSKPILDIIVNYIAIHMLIKPFVLKNRNKYTYVIDRWKSIRVIK